MPEYRAYILDADGRIQSVEIVTAPDDQAAIEVAKSLAMEYDVEIWHLDRKVTLRPISSNNRS